MLRSSHKELFLLLKFILAYLSTILMINVECLMLIF